MLAMKTIEADLKAVSYQSMKTSATGATPLRDYTLMVYRRHPGSDPAEQRKKKDWKQKSSSATASGMYSFL
jgi:hypothetical protein